MDRFWSKVEKSDGCWEWRGSKKEKGYGQFMVSKGVVRRAHRVAWEMEHGYVPSLLDHICRNPGCVRPSHLRPATNRQNVARSKKQSRHTSSKYKGVSRHYKSNGWCVSCGSKYVGYFECEEDAARAYDRAAKERYGEFALTNESLGLLGGPVGGGRADGQQPAAPRAGDVLPGAVPAPKSGPKKRTRARSGPAPSKNRRMARKK